MTLEDFFLLTNMKDGLSAPSRVEELVSFMQKEKDSDVKNIRDATKQWASVASAIAATENRDCLDRFIELDGLGFINRWLKQVQKFGNNTNEGFVEESITAMLGALEKLHIDYELSISSGIWITVKSLLGHSSSQVQDRARALSDSWSQAGVSETFDNDVKCVGSSQADEVAVSSILANESGRTESSALNVSLPNATVNEENNGVEPAGAELLPSECLQLEKAENIMPKTNNNEQCSHVKEGDTDMEDKPLDQLATSNLSNSVPQSSSKEDRFPVDTDERILSVEESNSLVPKECYKEEQPDAQKMNEFSKDENVPKVNSFTEKVCETASASTSTVEHKTVACAVDIVSVHDMTSGTAVEKVFDADEGILDSKATAFDEVRKLASDSKNGMDDMNVVNNCSTPVFKSIGEEDDCHSDAMQDSPDNECTYGKNNDLESSFSRIRGIGAVDRGKDLAGDGGSDSRKNFLFSKATMTTRISDAPNRRVSDVDLEYGIVDALELARKVAQEYTERSCSSSEKILGGGGIRPPESPVSVNENQDLVDEVTLKEVPTEQNYSTEAYPDGEGQLTNSDDGENEPGNGIVDRDSSLDTEAAQEPEVSRDKGFCDFDLNQEFCSDDMDNPINSVDNVSAPVSLVSASRPAAAPGLPDAPLRFEGTLGWKGTAATSAFRPASPRRVSDGDTTTPTVGGANSSKQSQHCLDFDLNVTESGDEKLPALIPEKQVPASSGIHSAESSVEVSPRRSERLNLDLNRVSDDSDAPPSELRLGRRFVQNRNGHQSPSPASSSSSMQLRNFDLNDRPFLPNDLSDQGPYHGKSSQSASAYGLPKPDDPIISIMGERVEVNRKEFIPQISFLPNGKSLETTMDGNLARSGSVLGLGPPSYTNYPVFGFNGFATASTLPYSSAIYGPGSAFPYMDLRGAPVVPQIVAAAGSVPSSYSHPSPLVMGMTGAPVAINVGTAAATRPNFDLNTGFPTEGGNRDSLGLRQLFIPGQVGSMEEHSRASSQPSSSGVGGKRKEPDGGWEFYPLNYRHPQPPWNH